MVSWSEHLEDQNAKVSIIGIPLEKEVPAWQSSTPLPERQLEQLASLGFVGDFKDYEINEEFAELVKGKTIAYVCPGPHLEGKGYGEFIDTHDLVVRVNQNFAVPEHQWADYGKRTDILYNCLNINKLRALSENEEYVKSLKFIVCGNVSMWDLPRVEDYLNSTGVPWNNMCDGYLFKLYREVGTTCNTGLVGVVDLLNYDPDRIFVTGMSFFNMNTFGKVYYDDYHDEAVKFNNFSDTKDKNPNVGELRMDIHNQEPQINYFRKIVNTHQKTLQLDEYLTENFSQEVRN